MHIEVEEEVLYPYVGRLGGVSADLVAALFAQHRQAEALISELAAASTGSAAITESAAALREALSAHRSDCEQELFPLIRELPEETLAALGRRLGNVRRNVREDALLPRLLAFTLRRASCCLDIGSHSGIVLREMLRCAPEGRHLAYEPIPELAARLRAGFPAVEVRQIAVSDADGMATFVHVTSAPAYSGLRPRPNSLRGWPDHIGHKDVQEISVRTERLDTSLPEGWRPDLIKIDTEGAELLVLGGALETVGRYQPVIIFEHMGSNPAYGGTSFDLWTLLTKHLDMRIYDLSGNGPYSSAEFCRSAELLLNTNYVARP